MNANPRCLFNSDFASFLHGDINSIFGALCDNYHGEALTTTREAWKSEIGIMRDVLAGLNDENGQIIFEYDIPRLGKRIDVVLLYRGIFSVLSSRLANQIFLKQTLTRSLTMRLI